MPERDPLDELRRAWSALEGPDATPEGGDAQTETAVAWLRAAWGALVAPEPSVPARLRRGPWRRRLLRARPLLAAAGVLLLWALFQRGPQEAEPAAELVELAAAPAVTAPPASQRRVVVDAPEDGLVLEHGSVRLVLLDPIEEHITLDPELGFEPTQEN
jgi:hypothetical protein